MKTRIASYRPIAVARGGFTLIEMLVATTLVVMMMLMFAQIYVAAIDSLGEQQALARNDGKARLADILLRGDLDRTSFHGTPNSSQGLLPLVKDDPVSQWQRGFFYISENDQSNPNDDVLHFTASIKEARNRDSAMYYGRAWEIDSVLESGTGGGAEYSNHPDIDDGDATDDPLTTSRGIGASRDAEICYFVRGGNLYRRVLLIRDIDLAGVPGANTAQPSSGVTEFNTRIIPANALATPSYYKAFDYAAMCRITDITDDTLDVVRFLGTDALQNQPQNSIYSTESLGCSMTRFGFAISAGNQANINANLTMRAIFRARGTPVEYDSLGNFFGRPLHGETGSHLWQWPGTRYNALNEVIVYSPNTNQMTVNGTPIVDPDTLQTRATEDLLLSGVEAFDIEVWDPGLMEDHNRDGAYDPGVGDLNGNNFPDQAGGFVQLGNSALTGYFRDAHRLNPFYGPGETDNNGNGSPDPAEDRNSNGVFDYSSVFDTGHPEMWTENLGLSGFGSGIRPPYRPLQYRIVELDANGDGNPDPDEDLNFSGALDTALPTSPVFAAYQWYPGRTYRCGEDLNNNGAIDAGEDVNGNTILDHVADVVFRPGDTTFSIGYRCVASGEDIDGDGYFDTNEDLPNAMTGNGSLDYGFSGATAPEWPLVPGLRVTEGTYPNQVTWEAFDNRIGLQKIRITIRVRDPREQLPRQFSIIHSFANPTKLN